MTRLIDADALLDVLPSTESGMTMNAVTVRVLVECSPTIRCDGCEKYKDNHTAIPTGWCKWHDAGMYPNDGCVRYRPRPEEEEKPDA